MMAITWAILATVTGLVIALLLGFRINHAGKYETDAAIIRNQRVMREVKTLLEVVGVATDSSHSAGSGGGDQRILPDAGCSPVDTSAKS
jgi:hypothetical protein